MVGIAGYVVSSRFMAFLAISCAIALVASISRDALLFWTGVAGLAAGNFYMWRTQYAPSRLRTVLLLAMMLILLAYLGQDMFLSGISNPLLLARYLVYGLIVGSFDLRTQRNVLGNLVLAGMIFVLLSHMAFGFWFVGISGVFVLLALAAATMGHVEETSSRAIVVGGRTWVAAGRVWLGFAPVTLLLAAVLFLLMPRIGSANLTPEGWLPSRIDLTSGGPGRSPSSSSDPLSSGILASLTDVSGDGKHVSLGYVGPEEDSVVMHVRSLVLSYWRGAVLDEYDGVGWLPSINTMELIDERQSQYGFPDSRLPVTSSRRYTQTYYLEIDQPNAIFTGYSPGRVYLTEGSLTFLGRGSVYLAVSPTPRLSPARLRVDRVDLRDVDYLALPDISQRTAALAESIVEGAPTDYDRAARLEEHLRLNYPYDLDVSPLTPGRDAVDEFLFEQKAGYCSQFATAMAVMARHVGLPARVSIGCLPGVHNPMTGASDVRAGDAHAWVEIRFRNNGWVPFDPTPRPDVDFGRGVGSGWLSFGLQDYIGLDFTGAISSLTLDWAVGDLAMPGWSWLALIFLITAAATAAALVLSRRRTAQKQAATGYTALSGDTRRLVLSTYRRMAALLRRRGLPPRQPSQAPGEYARMVAPLLQGGGDMVEWLSQAASAAAYSPGPLSPSLADEARQKLAALRRVLAVRTGL